METSAIVDMSPWVSVFGAMVGWVGFIIVFGMLKNFISKGLSIALANFLLENCDEKQTEKMVRWFAKKEDVLQELKEIKSGLGK